MRDYNFAFEKKLSGSYRQWEYCVQYQETDFAFVSRLMEHEGIYYYFKHEKNQHTLVLADDIGAHETLPGYPKISYLAADRDPDPFQEVIDQWQVTEEIRPGTYVVDDYDFKKSKADLMGMRSQPRGNPHDTYEIYEWLGGFSEAEQGEHYSRIRLEEAQSQAERGHRPQQRARHGAGLSLHDAELPAAGRQPRIPDRVGVLRTARRRLRERRRRQATTASALRCSRPRTRSARRA